MYFKQFLHDALGCSSYLIASRDSREAAVIDPHRDVQQYLDLAAERGYNIVAVIDTHLHADHVSGNRDLDTGDETELAAFNVDRGLGSPVSSPDGRQLAVFVGTVDDAGIRIINTDASELGQLTRTGRDISLRHAEILWSANGQAVFFSSVLRPIIEEEFHGGK